MKNIKSFSTCTDVGAYHDRSRKANRIFKISVSSLMAALMLASLAGCAGGGSSSQTSGQSTEPTAEPTTEAQTDAGAQATNTPKPGNIDAGVEVTPSPIPTLEPEPDSYDSGENTTYETVLSISASIGGDSLIQYIHSTSVEDGPADMLVADDESFYILNAMGDNILYYENGSLADTIDLAHCYVPVNLCLIGDKLYVLDGLSVWQYDTVTKNWREYPIPVFNDREPYYDYVCDMVVEESCIVLFSEKYGNLILNEDTGSFEPTDLGYYSTRVREDKVVIKRNGRQWVLNMPRVSTQVIYFDDNGNVYVEAIDLKLNEYDRGYCTVRKYSESGQLLGICPVNTTAWNNTPDKFAEIGADGSVYILSPEYDATRILKTALGGNASVIGTFPPDR